MRTRARTRTLMMSVVVHARRTRMLILKRQRTECVGSNGQERLQKRDEFDPGWNCHAHIHTADGTEAVDVGVLKRGGGKK